uniref:Uncharacterized protein n=1 Tax=viral metagenome TaxID=1070528 RepID=A0A6C0CMA1_9ZZZZ
MKLKYNTITYSEVMELLCEKTEDGYLVKSNLDLVVGHILNKVLEKLENSENALRELQEKNKQLQEKLENVENIANDALSVADEALRESD